jgi:hypothetical protein
VVYIGSESSPQGACMSHTTSPGLMNVSATLTYAVGVRGFLDKAAKRRTPYILEHKEDMGAFLALRRFFQKVLDGERIDSRQKREFEDYPHMACISGLCIAIDVYNHLNDSRYTPDRIRQLITPFYNMVEKLLAGESLNPDDVLDDFLCFTAELARLAEIDHENHVMGRYDNP